MPDEPTTPDAPEPPEDEGDEFDEKRAKAKIKQANQEAANLRRRLKDAEAKAAKYDELENEQKSETQKLTDRISALEAELRDAQLRADRLEVAIDKGLTKTQAKRLVGDSIDDLAADADELLETFGSTNRPEPPTSRPKERPRGGSDPEEDPAPDIRKIVDSIEPAF